MANRWTEEQLEAINTEGNNVIVSAGAGSGKTAVLTERVLRLESDEFWNNVVSKDKIKPIQIIRWLDD